MRKLFTTLLALVATLSVSAQVVYTGFENAPVVVSGDNMEYGINFMGGQPEFMLQNYYGEEVFFACFEPGTAVVSTPADYNANVNILSANTQIGPNSEFHGYNEVEMPFFGILYLDGQHTAWVGAGRKYVGFKFTNAGQTYYGWAELELPNAATIKLYGYAYQSTPNTPIVAGDKGNASINDVQENTISVYPNPVCDVLNVNVPNAETLSITNTLGQRVMEINNPATQINVSNLENGVYFLRVNNQTTKFIKR
ncbi:MAG: T9SS type A sorting domain-containing protein [Bacteroidales bacterium]|nr:T9SS type A sorting domain-containing protein [Bacteroidales bacterium]